jgi:predicted ester cyclase
MTDAKALIHRWFEEVWNHGREGTIDELFAQGAIAYGLGEEGAEVRGPNQFKTFWRNLRSALPNIHIRIEDTIADGDKVVVRVLLEGTHTGDGLGVRPSRNRVAVPAIVIVRVSGGQIVEAWNSWDQLGLLQQTGAIHAPQASDRFLTARV